MGNLLAHQPHQTKSVGKPVAHPTSEPNVLATHHRHTKKQPENQHGASAACRHLGKPAISCLISNVATSRRRSITIFRLPQILPKKAA
ncbi:hypothetical protein [Kingella oralis]|uniref:hypothetical protein n=1 Tax=Kingella oralis TaxID=505 RepID=UPI002D7F0A30|nr:hypothetical protein [Kingella oralis]